MKKSKSEKGAILHKEVGDSFPEEVTFKQKSEGMRRIS